MLAVNEKAYPFSSTNQHSETIKLSDFQGKKVVLYFYPKDNTPGCTLEAQSFQEANEAIESLGAVVIGVSPDSEKSHQSFCDKFGLKFNLLADTDNTIATAFGAYGEKKNYGKTYMGIIRSTFIIDEDGTIIKVYPKVKAEGHGQAVLEFLKG